MNISYDRSGKAYFFNKSMAKVIFYYERGI